MRSGEHLKIHSCSFVFEMNFPDVNCSNCLFEVFDPWMTKANQLTESIFQTTEIQMAKVETIYNQK